MLTREYRLTKNWQIKRVMSRGERSYAPDFILNWYQVNRPEPKFAFIASKKVGKAVKRNRAIRLLREGVRSLIKEDKIPKPYDYVIVARDTCKDRRMQQIKDELEEGFTKVVN